MKIEISEGSIENENTITFCVNDEGKELVMVVVKESDISDDYIRISSLMFFDNDEEFSFEKEYQWQEHERRSGEIERKYLLDYKNENVKAMRDLFEGHERLERLKKIFNSSDDIPAGVYGEYVDAQWDLKEHIQE